MAQRPSIRQPKPLSAPLSSAHLPAGQPVPSAVAQPLGEIGAEVSPEAAPLWNLVLTHARWLALGVLFIVVAIMAVGIWRWYEEKTQAEARLELGRISSVLDPAARLSALEAFAPHAPAAIIKAVQLEIALAAAQSEQWEKAAAAYAEVADEEEDGSLALVARLNEADILLRLKRPAEAMSRLESLLPAAPKQMIPMLNQQIAEAAEAAGQKEKAISAWEAALTALPKEATTEAAWYRARIAALQ